MPAEKKAATAATAPKTASKATATAPTVTLKQLAADIAASQGHQRKELEAILNTLVEEIVSHLKGGDRIRINGLGIMEVKKRAARTGRNPATGEQIEIAASKKVTFRPAKELKEAV